MGGITDRDYWSHLNVWVDTKLKAVLADLAQEKNVSMTWLVNEYLWNHPNVAAHRHRMEMDGTRITKGRRPRRRCVKGAKKTYGLKHYPR